MSARPEWTTAVPDWEERLVAGRSIIPPPIYPNEAERALAIFKSLQVVDLGQTVWDDELQDMRAPTFGECSEQWVFDFVSAIFGAYDAETGQQLITEFYLLISKKNSKALALDTPIPTPAGWTTMGALQAGDWVYGVNGKPCRVTATSEVFHGHDCYRMGFSNGESVVADAGHLWLTDALHDQPGRGGGRRRGDLPRNRVRTTKEIAGTLVRPRDGARNHSMQMPAPIECPVVDLPIPPYTLGAWLGDGNTASAKITTHIMDVEILGRIIEEGIPVRYSSNNGSAASTYAMSDGDVSQKARNASLAARLRRAGVLENKHIPEAYFRASYEQRLALLQGLMDTDGCANKTGRNLVFSSTLEVLAQGVADLLATFGIKSTIVRTVSRLNGVRKKDAFRVQFMAFRDELPAFGLKRKLDRMRVSGQTKNTARSRTVQIVTADLVPSVPTRCIRVDSEDHQFLFGRTMLPTHNSTIAAGIMLTATILCWRHGEELLILAPTKEVAEASFNPAASMVRADKELRHIFLVQDHLKTISHRVTKAKLKVVAADTDTVSGKKSGRILIDEHWVFGKRDKADAMFMEATGGQISRPEGWTIILTTQSDEPPAGVFKEKLEYYRQVRDGEVLDPKRLGVLYEFPRKYVQEERYLLRENFYVTNPNMGRSVSGEWLEDNLRIHRNSDDKGAYAKFIAKHLNIEIGLNLRAGRWAGTELWPAAGKHPGLTLPGLIAMSEVCTVGIDGGGLDDLLALTVTGRTLAGKWVTWSHAWANPTVLERRKNEAPRFRDFAKAGDLTLVENPGEDVVQLAGMVAMVEEAKLLNLVGVDPHGLGGILDALDEAGVPAEKIIAISQGWKLSGAIKTAERRLNEGIIEHAAQPMMIWCAGNAKVTPVGNAVNITKQVSGSGKIDPLMSFFNSIELMSRNPAKPGKKFQALILG